MIAQIILKNFQKHSDLTIDLVEGVNIVYGSSDAGKSCIRRALEWVLLNEKIDGVRKSGTKLTSVRITLHNGAMIEREKSASINRYNLRKTKLDDIMTFDAIGKTIPQEIKDVIGIEPLQIEDEEFYLNSAPQLALPFLFDKSPTWRMKLFNKLTGNDLLDKLFVSFNKELLSINKEIKTIQEALPNQKIELENREIEIEKGTAKQKKITKSLSEIEEKYSNYNKINELVEEFSVNAVHQVRAESALKDIKIPEDIDIKGLSKKIEDFTLLQSLYNALQSTNAKESIQGQLADIRLPETKFIEETRAKIDLLAKMQEIEDGLEINQKRQSTLTKDLECGILTIQEQEGKYKTLLLEAKICPTCGKGTCDESTG